MRNKIFGGIGVLWGGSVLVRTFLQGAPQGDSAYAAGQKGGIVFAVLLVAVGFYYLIKGGSQKKTSAED